MQKLILLLWLWILSFSAIQAQSIKGKWKTIDDNTGKARSIVWIYEAKNGKYYGKITKLLDPSEPNPVCEKCSDERKNKPIQGLVIIKGLQKKGDVWQNGKILDPENGKEYSCKLWLESGKLKVRGYWGMFYRTQTWYKAN